MPAAGAFMSFAFLSPTAAGAVARSPMERQARAAGARFEVRDGWNVAVAYGVDSESVSWPTITCSFCSRSTRCGSSPNGRAPAATSASQTCSP